MTEHTHISGDQHWTLPLDPASTRVLVNGFQSWSEAELHPLTATQARPTLVWMQEHGHDPAFLPGTADARPGVWRSHTLIALVRPDGSGHVGYSLDETRSYAHWERAPRRAASPCTCTSRGPAPTSSSRTRPT